MPYYTHPPHHYTARTITHNNQQQLVHLIIQHRVTSAQTSAAVGEGKGTRVVGQRAKGGGNWGKHLQRLVVTSSTNRTTGTRGEHGIEGGVQGVHVQSTAAGKQT